MYSPWASEAAIALRLLDDAGKRDQGSTSGFADYLPLLQRLADAVADAGQDQGRQDDPGR